MRYQRELTAAVLIPAVLGILVVGPSWAFAVLVTLAGGLALLEFYRLLAGAGLEVPRLAGGLVFGAAVAAAFLGSAAALVAVTGAGLVLLPALVLFARPPVGVLLASASTAVFATLYVSAGAAAVVALRGVSWKPVLFLLAVVWAGDSAAYYTGRRWGRRKLAPVVSPKKTWEGFWGQVAGGALAGAGAAALAPGAPGGRGALLGALFGAAAGALLSGAAVVGDLVESTFKRSLDVKDSGGLLPGHGGLLDRLDSLLYAAPVLLGFVLSPAGTFLR